jgi:DNA-binding winged helix-turn-helix (wHTH) protein/TolB-like protein/Tfp pilus assembly protein PilF
MSLESQRFFTLGSFRLDTGRRVLLRGDEAVVLRPRVFDTLLLLTTRRGEVVTKEELMDSVWPDTVVEENNLNQNILALRRILESTGNGDVRIETVPRRGYRLISPAAEDAPAATPPPSVRESAAVVPGMPRRRTLPRSAAAALAVGALVLGAGAVWRLTRAPRPILGVRSIAVLPLKSLVGGGQDDYLGLPLADAIITRLGFVRSLTVRPTAAVRAFGGPSLDPAAAGRALQVDAVLDGRIQRLGDRLRVTVQLVSSRDGATLWSEKLDVKSADLFGLEDSISEAATRALTAGLSAGEAGRVGRNRPTTPDVYEAYLKGRYFWSKRTEKDLRQALGFFEQAVARDPNYAPAYSGIADSYFALGAVGYSAMPPSEAMPRARAAAERALALDDSMAEAHSSLAMVRAYHDWQWVAAENGLRHAIELNPSYATARQWHALVLATVGRVPESIEEIERAHALDPLSLIVMTAVGRHFHYARRYDQAEKEFRSVVALDTNFPQAHRSLGVTLQQQGRLPEAIEEFRTALRLAPESMQLEADLGYASALSGNREEALRIRTMLVERSKQRYVPSYLIALVHAGLNDKDAALEWMEKAYAERSMYLVYLAIEPALDPLRADPRFGQLLRRMGLSS